MNNNNLMTGMRSYYHCMKGRTVAVADRTPWKPKIFCCCKNETN